MPIVQSKFGHLLQDQMKKIFDAGPQPYPYVRLRTFHRDCVPKKRRATKK